MLSWRARRKGQPSMRWYLILPKLHLFSPFRCGYQLCVGLLNNNCHKIQFIIYPKIMKIGHYFHQKRSHPYPDVYHFSFLLWCRNYLSILRLKSQDSSAVVWPVKVLGWACFLTLLKCSCVMYFSHGILCALHLTWSKKATQGKKAAAAVLCKCSRSHHSSATITLYHLRLSSVKCNLFLFIGQFITLARPWRVGII